MYSKQQDLFSNMNNETNLKLPSVYTKTTLYGKWATPHNHTTQKPQQTSHLHHSMCFRIPASVFSKAGLLEDSIQMWKCKRTSQAARVKFFKCHHTSF
jgi:hypothetical protein